MGVVISVGNGFAKSDIRTDLLARRGHITERVNLRHTGQGQARQSGQPLETAQGDGSSSESQAPRNGGDARLLPPASGQRRGCGRSSRRSSERRESCRRGGSGNGVSQPGMPAGPGASPVRAGKAEGGRFRGGGRRGGRGPFRVRG